MPGGGDLGAGVGGLVGGVAVLAGLGGKGGDKQRKQALAVWQKLQLSDFNMASLSPPEIQLLGSVYPELYTEIVKGQPPEIQDSPDVRAVTVRSIQKLEEIGKSGLPTAERLAAETAQRRVAQASSNAQTQVLRDLSERGRLGAGDEISARLAANQASQNAGAMAGNELAMQGTQNRIGATMQAGEMASGLRGQDIARNTAQQSLMARYNELASSLATQRAQANAAERARAQTANAATRQHVGEANEQARYGTALENLQRQNALRGVSFGQRLAKTQGVSNAYTGFADAEDEKRRNREQALMATGQGAGRAAGGGIGGGLF